MESKRLLGYFTGSVNEDHLLRSEFLAEENRILASKLGPRVRHADPERILLATIGRKLGLKALEGLRLGLDAPGEGGPGNPSLRRAAVDKITYPLIDARHGPTIQLQGLLEDPGSPSGVYAVTNGSMSNSR